MRTLTTRHLMVLAATIGWNLFTLIGVLLWHWPVGNIFALFWVENVLNGLASLPRVVVAARRQGRSGLTMGAFFCFHYGLFCLVHGAFTVFVALAAGFHPTVGNFVVPVVLLVVRYAVEVISWVRAGSVMDASESFFSPYRRVIVLHVALLLGFAVVLSNFDKVIGTATGAGGDSSLWHGMSLPWVLLAILLVVKTVVDSYVLLSQWRAEARGETIQPSLVLPNEALGSR